MARVKRRHDPNQLTIDWATAPCPPPHVEKTAQPQTPDQSATVAPRCTTQPDLIERLPWDFRTSFPDPTEQALAEGVIQDEDNTPTGIKSIHDEHAREALAALHDLDAVLDARRRGVDPSTGKPPRTHASRERLRQFLDKEPGRLERHFDNLLAVYRDAFGADAGDAFEKAIKAWHAGIPVVSTQAREPRISSALPVPKPLPAATSVGHFGQEEDGKPVRPTPAEVRAITEQHAGKLVELLAQGDEAKANEAVRKYADDFGERPARRLEAYARRELSEQDRADRSRRR